MDDILSNFSFKLQPKENGKSPIEYIVYCIDKKYYMVEKITDKSLFFYNKTIIKKFINKLYKSYYFKNDIDNYSFYFQKQFELIENEYFSSKQFSQTLNDFLYFIENINEDINSKVVKHCLIKYTNNSLTKELPIEIINQILKLIWLK